MSWLTPLDNYCERIDSTFWSEPLNALTNFSFFVAFIYCQILLRRATGHPSKKFLQWINFTILLTSVGSFVFHTLATKLTMWGDIVPILLFLLSVLYYIFKQGLFWPKIKIYGFLILFLIASVLLCLPPFNKLLNGSLLYAPTLLILGYLSTFFKKLRWVLLAFLLSLLARTIDHSVCEVMPLGTHFLWHVLNGLVMVFTFKILIDISESNTKRKEVNAES